MKARIRQERPAPTPDRPPMTAPMHSSRSMRRALVFGLPAAAGAILAAPALGTGRGPSAPDVLRIGVAHVGGGEPMTWGGTPGGVVRGLGWLDEAFRDSGTRIEWSFHRGAGPAINEALANRAIDFAWQGDLPAIIGRSNGLKTRILLACGVRNNLYVAVGARSSARALGELAGRRVALSLGTNGHLVARRILAGAGMTERDLRLVPLDPAAARSALLAGGVDAAFGGYEYFDLRDDGAARLIYSTQGLDPQLTRQAHLLVRDPVAERWPDATQRVVDVFVRAAAWASDEANRDRLFALWSRGGTPDASFAAEFADQRLADRNSPLIDEFVIARYQAVARDARDMRLVARRVALDGWFDRRFLDAALQRQHLTARWSAFDATGTIRGDAPLARAGAEGRA